MLTSTRCRRRCSAARTTTKRERAPRRRDRRAARGDPALLLLPESAGAPSRFEAIAATAWLWFRRLLCFGFAVGCFATAYAFAFGDAMPRDGRSAAPVIVFAMLFGAFAVYV